MITDYTPTIESLIAQGAVEITGDTDLIERCLRIIERDYIWKGITSSEQDPQLAIPASLRHTEVPCELFDVMYPTEYHLENRGKQKSVIAKFVSTHPDNYEATFYRNAEHNRLLRLKFLTTILPTAPLYTVHLNSDFRVTAHVHTHNGTYDKIVYEKARVNPKRLTHSIKALCRAIDKSDTFFICQKCHRLVDSNFKSTDSSPCCAYDACRNLVKQPFDVSLVDRISGFFDKNIRVDVIKNEIVISIGEIVWLGPHDPALSWVPKKKLPLATTPQLVREEAQAIKDSHVFELTCIHCHETCNVGFMFTKDTCDSCAYHVYGVMF